MNLTGKQLVEQGIITGVIKDENIQQHGIDLNVVSIAKIDSSVQEGRIPCEGKTLLATRTMMPLHQYDDFNSKPRYWSLEPGTYDILLNQGCKVPCNQRLFIRQRSSLLRNGTILHSSVFDAGFFTDRIGTVMIVTVPIIIEEGARVAQIYSSCSNVVENLYDGQWQGDKQRG